MVCSVLANIHRDKRKRSTAFTPQDFMPRRKKEIEIPDGELLYKQTLALFGTPEDNT